MNASHQTRRALAALIAIPVVAALVLSLFAWPSSRLEPRDLPVGVVGTEAELAEAEERLAAADGSFDVHPYPDHAAARDAIADRDIYGAFVATDGGIQTLTASAASPAVAQLLEGAAADGSGGSATTVDVVPAPEEDPRGAGFSASVLPLILAGMLTGVAATFLAPNNLRRAAIAVFAAALTGLAATAIVQGWLGVIDGDWAANWAALSLTIIAIASTAIGLAANLGRVGIALAALLMVVIANPFSAISSAPELLPEPVGALGQLMPAGAGGNLIRSTGFFDGAGAGDHVLVLTAWALLGLGGLLLAMARQRRPSVAAAPARA